MIGKPRICVVIDTSIWRSQPLLQTPLGKSLTYLVHRLSGCIGMPEVIELELKRQLLAAGLESLSKVETQCGILDCLAGNTIRNLLPTKEVIQSRIESKLSEFEPMIVREPFTLEHAKRALWMVDRKLPPNTQNQQFKDSAIWVASVSLAKRYSTHLITADKAFFENRDPRFGLASNLVTDCKEAGVDVSVHNDIPTFFQVMKAVVPTFDRASVVALVEAAVLPRLTTHAQSQGFEIVKVDAEVIDAFPTEVPNRIAIDYTVVATLQDSEAGRNIRRGGIGKIHGSVYFDSDSKTLKEHYVQQIDLSYEGGYYGRTYRDYDEWVQFPRPLPGN